MANGKLPLVLLPGLLCTAALWEAQKVALCETANVVVAPLTGDDSMAGMAESVLASAPDRFALAGLSMGGYVALEIMRRAPGRVEKLALLDTSARADDPARTAEREELLLLAQQGAFDAVVRRLLPALIHPDRLAGDRALCDAVVGMAHKVGPRVYLRQMKAIMGRPDSRDGLSEIRCPTLLLCGAEDARTPPAVHEEMAAAIPDARLVVVPHCGHLSTMERPDAVNIALKDWLGV